MYGYLKRNEENIVNGRKTGLKNVCVDEKDKINWLKEDFTTMNLAPTKTTSLVNKAKSVRK